jgi:hypothetical protein
LTNPVTGTGTTNYLPKFTGTSALGNSLVYDNGTNVGIGTQIPVVKLTVASSGQTAWFYSTSDPVPVSVFNTGSPISTIGFKGSTTASNYTVRVGADGNNFVAYANNAEKMRITSTGNVGIGTTSPSQKLDVVGKIALNDGGNSVFIGTDAGLNDDASANRNVGVGHRSLYSNTTGNHNTANGYHSLYSNTEGNNNTANGFSSLYSNTTGNNNTANGYASLYSNTTSNSNTAIGRDSLYSNTTGGRNTATGKDSLRANTTGENNTANGHQSGRYISNGTTENTITNNSIYLGSNTKALADNQTNQIVIGYDATGLGSNTVVLGNDSIVTTALKGNVGIGTTAPGAKLTIPTGNIVFGANTSPYSGLYTLSVVSSDLSAVFNANQPTSTTSGRAFSVGSPNETYVRTVFYANGSIGIGPGSATRDTFITRSDFNTLRIGGNYDGTGTGNLIVNNKVGIGTTVPSQPLHVAGNIRIEGALYDSNNSSGTLGQVLSSTATGTDWVDVVDPNAIPKDVGTTYNTNFIKSVTQAEYDAIVTKDPTTLYFIV